MQTSRFSVVVLVTIGILLSSAIVCSASPSNNWALDKTKLRFRDYVQGNWVVDAVSSVTKVGSSAVDVAPAKRFSCRFALLDDISLSGLCTRNETTNDEDDEVETVDALLIKLDFDDDNTALVSTNEVVVSAHASEDEAADLFDEAEGFDVVGRFSLERSMSDRLYLCAGAPVSIGGVDAILSMTVNTKFTFVSTISSIEKAADSTYTKVTTLSFRRAVKTASSSFFERFGPALLIFIFVMVSKWMTRKAMSSQVERKQQRLARRAAVAAQSAASSSSSAAAAASTSADADADAAAADSSAADSAAETSSNAGNGSSGVRRRRKD